MRRRIAMLLSFILLLSLVGCQNKTGMSKEELKKLYEDAITKCSEMKDMDADAVVDMKLSAGGQSLNMKMDMDILATDIYEDNMKYYIKETGNLLGQSLDVDIYFEDGYCYTDMLGTKTKSKVDLQEFMNQYKTTTDASSMKYDYMKSIEAKKDGGNTTFIFTLDENKIEEYTKGAMGSMGEAMEKGELKFSKAVGEMTINKDGYVSNMKIDMSFAATVEGQEAKMDLKMNLKYNNPGQSVTMPEFDKSGYTETENSNLGL